MKLWILAVTNIFTAFAGLSIGWKSAPQLDAAISPCLWGIAAVDGDTIKCNGRLIRLVGLDTPEIKHPACSREREVGLRAKARLADLLHQLDWFPRKTGSSGGHGRWETDLVVDGVRVAEILIREGLAIRSKSRKSQHDWCNHIDV